MNVTEEELITLTAIEAAELISGGELSAEEYVGACLDRIAAIDGEVQAFVHLDPEHALDQARALDELRRNGRPLGPLHGVPVAIKDIFDTEDYPTECGSPLLAGRRPLRDAGVVTRLRIAGAVIIGKTVTTEFAFMHPGPTRNPRDLQRTPGGSSSGSAAAVAAGMVPLALGSQTNGSTIRPAAFCGVYGVKPSHGMISRARALMLSQALDHVGLFARTLADAALFLDVLAGFDPDDSDTRPRAAPDFLDTLTESPPLPPRLAFVRTPVWDKTEPNARSAIEVLAGRLGAEPVDLPEAFAGAWDNHRAIMAADMADRLGELVARGGEASSQTIRDFLAEASGISATRYLAARRQARHYAAELREYFDLFDAILTPAAAGVAPRGTATGDPAFCTLWTLTGLPALSLPLLVGESDMPLGVQLVGAAGDDARLLRTANWLIEQVEG
jgi:Asp-tRNA(Asn)/Glu-tRNA(Gln) amidotransferase A subunit family amidase